MKTTRFFSAAVLAALAILLGGAALRSRTASGPAVHNDLTPETIAPSHPDDGYVWDPVDRYWDRDRNSRRDR